MKNDEEELDDLPSMPLLEGNEEEINEGDGLKILTPNKLLTRLYSHKSKPEIIHTN